jgi:DNA-binding transcriptional MerR regulator
MKDKYNIKEVAEILNVPKSTLRYWDSEDLIMMDRNQINDYREYSVKQIVDISDIAFYRSINVPITKLKKIYEMNLKEFDYILEETGKDIDAQIAALKTKKKGIVSRKEKIRELEFLSINPYLKSNPDMDAIVDFHMSHFVDIDPYDFAILMSPKDNYRIQYGSIISCPANDDTIIWNKANLHISYIQCLLKVCVDNPEKNNLDEHLLHINQMGYKAGNIVGRYLITATDDIRYEYYKVWIEIINN